MLPLIDRDTLRHLRHAELTYPMDAPRPAPVDFAYSTAEARLNGCLGDQVTEAGIRYPHPVSANGNGVPLCYGCHAASRNDFVLTGFPLK